MHDRQKNEYTPERASPPGETLAEILDDRGMSQAELAERMGRPKKTINEIIQAKAALTSETALQLERVLGVPASFWSNLERNYRDSLARQAERDSLRKYVNWPASFPLLEMRKYGWIERRVGSADLVRSLLDFFGVSTFDQWEARYARVAAAYRRPTKFEPDPFALAAWLREGEREAQRLSCEPFDAEQFTAGLHSARALTLEAEPRVFISRLQQIGQRAGVAIVFVRELSGSRACGATRWLGPQKALIQLSLRYRSNDHLWFTFFHEAGHVVKHGKRDVFLEAAKGGMATPEVEKEADAFAANFLIPPEAFRRLTTLAPYSEARVRDFATEIGIAPGIVVGRLQHEELLPFTHLNALKIRYAWAEPGD
jgi:HTH-type transcriptional regulator / antitoxin HigA